MARYLCKKEILALLPYVTRGFCNTSDLLGAQRFSVQQTFYSISSFLFINHHSLGLLPLQGVQIVTSCHTFSHSLVARVEISLARVTVSVGLMSK